jgi:hypothetical protein
MRIAYDQAKMPSVNFTVTDGRFFDGRPTSLIHKDFPFRKHAGMQVALLLASKPRRRTCPNSPNFSLLS